MQRPDLGRHRDRHDHRVADGHLFRDPSPGPRAGGQRRGSACGAVWRLRGVRAHGALAHHRPPRPARDPLLHLGQSGVLPACRHARGHAGRTVDPGRCGRRRREVRAEAAFNRTDKAAFGRGRRRARSAHRTRRRPDHRRGHRSEDWCGRRRESAAPTCRPVDAGRGRARSAPSRSAADGHHMGRRRRTAVPRVPLRHGAASRLRDRPGHQRCPGESRAGGSRQEPGGRAGASAGEDGRRVVRLQRTGGRRRDGGRSVSPAVEGSAVDVQRTAGRRQARIAHARPGRATGTTAGGTDGNRALFPTPRVVAEAGPARQREPGSPLRRRDRERRPCPPAIWR